MTKQRAGVLGLTRSARAGLMPHDYSKLESLRVVTNAHANGVSIADLRSAIAALEAHVNANVEGVG